MRRLAQCAAGTASVEAVVLLPFFALLLAGALHIHHLAFAQQSARADARACAYLHAMRGCGSEAPSLCGQRPDRHGAQDEGRQQLAEVGDYDDFVKDLGFLSSVVEGFLGESFAVTRAEQVGALMAPEETVEVSAGQVLLCNPSPPSFGGFVRDIFALRNKYRGGP